MSQIVTQRVQNPDGSVTEFNVKVLAGGPLNSPPAALVQPAPVPAVEVAHVQARPVAVAEPVAEDVPAEVLSGADPAAN